MTTPPPVALHPDTRWCPSKRCSQPVIAYADYPPYVCSWCGRDTVALSPERRARFEKRWNTPTKEAA